jgi:hypothetical protein
MNPVTDLMPFGRFFLSSRTILVRLTIGRVCRAEEDAPFI